MLSKSHQLNHRCRIEGSASEYHKTAGSRSAENLLSVFAYINKYIVKKLPNHYPHGSKARTFSGMPWEMLKVAALAAAKASEKLTQITVEKEYFYNSQVVYFLKNCRQQSKMLDCS